MKEELEVIHNILTQKGWTIATAESMTAGLIVSTLASQSGSSAYLQGGIVAYTLDAKVKLLLVDRDVAAACNCVSPDVALHMALGIKYQFGTTCGIAVTGYAEPYKGEEAHAYYVVFCGDTFATGTVVEPGLSRNEMREEVVRHTLQELASLLEDCVEI